MVMIWEHFDSHCLSFYLHNSSGHVESGEDDLTTALRETREETGYREDDLIIYQDQKQTLEYKVTGKKAKVKVKTVVYWLAELRNASQVPDLSDEHNEFRWLAKDDTITLGNYPNFIKMVQDFHTIIPNLQNSS